MTAPHPIPDSALDDRLGFVGTAGSGKTYNSKVAAERLLRARRRVIVVDPPGVWYGLRLDNTGKHPSHLDVVIIGGEHGDLPLTENAGQLIGEAVSSVDQSFIIDLSGLGTKASERRFMLAFLTALYRHTDKSPVHLIVDEADMFAPERLLDKDGDAARLLGMMETIVRRGRVKGFIPWLITQRPAVLSKNVLSMVDGLISFKLTSPQDRAALGHWVEGQASKDDWKQISATLPTLERGQGVVWLPHRNLLATSKFPASSTFDSSKTPERGSVLPSTKLASLDLGALRSKLSSVEERIRSEDPRMLRVRIAELEKQLKKPVEPVEPPAEFVARVGLEARSDYAKEVAEEIRQVCDSLLAFVEKSVSAPKRAPLLTHLEIGRRLTPKSAASEPRRAALNGHAANLGGGVRRILIALAQRRGGLTQKQIGVRAGLSSRSGTFSTYLSRARTSGWIEGRGELKITGEGLAALGAYDPLPTGHDLLQYWLGELGSSGAARILRVVAEAYPKGLTNAEVGERAGISERSGAYSTYLSRLRGLELIEGRGELRAAEELF